MNILFEISDTLLIAVSLILVIILLIIAIIIKKIDKRAKPISEDERFDNEDLQVVEVSKEELTDDQKEAKAELEKVFEKMNHDLEKQKSAHENVEEFEKKQEENAIISYQELMKQAETLKKEALKHEKEEENVAAFDVNEMIKPSKKQSHRFRSSDIVSPIYGVQSNKNMIKSKKSSYRDLEKEQDDFEKEQTQNLDFLNSLKEFRKNL